MYSKSAKNEWQNGMEWQRESDRESIQKKTYKNDTVLTEKICIELPITTATAGNDIKIDRIEEHIDFNRT